MTFEKPISNQQRLTHEAFSQGLRATGSTPGKGFLLHWRNPGQNSRGGIHGQDAL